jgi:hypothetical protein
VSGRSHERLLFAAVLCYGVLNACLYAGLLPLWEGFDEPFHYGYVRALSSRARSPVLGRSFLSRDIAASLKLAPASLAVKRNLPFVRTHDQFLRLGADQQKELRTKLENLEADAGDSQLLNYEAQQPPLAYALLAPADIAFGGLAFLTRVLLLRLLCAIGAAAATGLLVFRLGHQLGLPVASRAAAGFVIFSSQMFYAATAHISDDWLAVPLFTFVVTSAIWLWTRPSAAGAAVFGVALGAGLLAKSYMLALAPFAAAVVLWLALRRRLSARAIAAFAAALLAAAGPWYARNLFLYGNLSGMQETTGGVPLAALVSAAKALPWLQMAGRAARAALWTGNNSFVSFGAAAITMQLALITAGCALYLWVRRKGVPAAERLVIAACLWFALGLIYAAVVAFWSSRGEAMTPAPWYTQAMLAPAWCLIFTGLNAAGRAGAVLRGAIVWLWAYMLCATYFAKLIPLYAGYQPGPVRLLPLARWYATSWRAISDKLSLLAMLPAPALLAMAGLAAIAALLLAARLTFTAPGRTERCPGSAARSGA